MVGGEGEVPLLVDPFRRGTDEVGGMGAHYIRSTNHDTELVVALAKAPPPIQSQEQRHSIWGVLNSCAQGFAVTWTIVMHSAACRSESAE